MEFKREEWRQIRNEEHRHSYSYIEEYILTFLPSLIRNIHVKINKRGSTGLFPI
jgi:hypothetical protein